MDIRNDSTLRFSLEKGFGQSYFVSCMVCGNHGVKITEWEKGPKEVNDCLVCMRIEASMKKGGEERS